MSQEHDPLIGRTIRGSIKIIRRIGEGGMGFVYEAYQEHLERRLAVKVMTPEHARNPVAADYFLREARSAARLRHPNIIQIIDFGREDDHTLFLAMEFVPGRQLSDVLFEDFPLPTDQIIAILVQTLSGLEEAHAHQIIHRDLKPDNLMIEITRAGRPHVKILDFGIAHLRDSEQKVGVLTQQGAILGTPHYMSPEQARGERVDSRSDLFAIGVILYEMLTHSLPFQGDNVAAILMHVMNRQPPPPSVLRRDLDIDPGLEAICLRAMHKDMELRYQSAREFRQALERLRDQGNTQAAPPPAAQFIFKRSNSKQVKALSPSDRHVATTSTPPPQPHHTGRETAVPKKKIKSFMPFQDTDPNYPGFEERSSALVVDVNDLFSSMEEPSESISSSAGQELDNPARQAATSNAFSQRPRSDLNPTVVDANATTAEPLVAPAPSSPFERLFTPPAGSPSAPGAASTAGAAPRNVLDLDIDALKESLVGEKRHVAILVIHQRLSRQLDAEALVELHAQIDAVTKTLARQWQASLHSRQGGFLTFLLGFERASQNDVLQAANFALSLRDALQAIDVSGAMSFGFALSHGEVFSPDQSVERADGPMLTLATELARAASSFAIVLGDESRGDTIYYRLEPGFALSPRDAERPHPELLGIRQIGLSSSSSILEEDSPSLVGALDEGREELLVGREIQIAELLRHLGRLMRMEGGRLLLLGEGGVGKSAIARRARQLASERQIPTLQARQVFSGAHGVRDLLKQWALQALRALSLSDHLDEGLAHKLAQKGIATESARLIQNLLQDDLGPVGVHHRDAQSLIPEADLELAMEAALRHLLLVVAESHGLLLVLDEVHELDPPLVRLCTRFATFLEHAPVLCLFSVREAISSNQDFPSRPLQELCATLRLERLDPSFSSVLLRALLQDTQSQTFKINLTQESLKKLVSLSAGNPLHLHIIARLLLARPDRPIEEIAHALATSSDVSGLVRLQLAALPSNAQNMLALLSVFGDGIEAEMAIDLSSKAWQPEDVLQLLHQSGFLQVELHTYGARLFFSPPALRLAVYETLSRRNRLRVHDRAAIYLHQKLQRQSGELDPNERRLLARHFEALGRHELALEQFKFLYQRAFSSFQYQEAQDLLAHMEACAGQLELPSHDQTLLRYQLDHVRLLAARNQAKRALEQIIKLDRDRDIQPPLRYEIRLELARLWLEHEDPSMIEGMLATLIGKLRQLSTQNASITWMLLRALCLQASAHEKQNHFSQAAQNLLDVVSLIHAQQEAIAQHNPVGPSLFWEPLNQLGRVRLKTQDLQGAGEMFSLALEHATSEDDLVGQLTIRGNRATLLAMKRHGDEALQELDTALELARRTGQLIGVAKLLFNQGLVLLRMQSRNSARRAFQESERLCRELDWREGLAMNLHQLRSLSEDD